MFYRLKTIENLIVICAMCLSLLFYITSCDKLPDETIVNELPAYYTESGYLDGRVDEVVSAMEQMEECESFFWISDIHWEPDLNGRHSPAIIRYLADRIGIDKILNGGDTGNSSVICTNAINRLRDAIGSDMVYSVNGNHEINDASRYEKPFIRVHKALRGHCRDIVYGDKNKSYFYFDREDSKVRYIGLSTYGFFTNNEYESAYTEEQLQWFKDIALDVAEGWTIVIFTHSLYHVTLPSNELTAISQSFVDVIDHYQGKGKIACVLMGHSHVDRVHIGKTGIPYILSQCDRTEPYRGDINVERVPGTASENHFEVVLIDKVKQEVRLYAIGSDARDGVDNEPGEIVDVRILKYGE